MAEGGGVTPQFTPEQAEAWMREKLKAGLADMIGKPVDHDAIVRNMCDTLEGLMPPLITVDSAELKGDILHVDVTVPRCLAIEAGLAPAVEFTVHIEATDPKSERTHA
jgi:hypothetical protein